MGSQDGSSACSAEAHLVCRKRSSRLGGLASLHQQPWWHRQAASEGGTRQAASEGGTGKLPVRWAASRRAPSVLLASSRCFCATRGDAWIVLSTPGAADCSSDERSCPILALDSTCRVALPARQLHLRAIFRFSSAVLGQSAPAHACAALPACASAAQCPCRRSRWKHSNHLSGAIQPHRSCCMTLL